MAGKYLFVEYDDHIFICFALKLKLGITKVMCIVF